MSKKRAARREAERKATKLARDLERLAAFEIGASAERPIVVTSPAEVEVHVASARCPICGGALRLDEHAAETIDGQRVRVARVACTACGRPRAIYFQLTSARLS